MTDRQCTIVVHGTGGLPLGLLCRQLGDAGHFYTLVGRLNPDDEKRRAVVEAIRGVGGFNSGESEESAQYVTVPRLIVTGEGTGDADLAALLRQPGDVLYLHSVRRGQAGIVEGVASAVADRRTRSVPGILYLMPCENTVADEIAALESRLHGPGFTYMPAMVDRICSNVTLPPKSRTPLVTAEEEYEWAAQLDDADGGAHDAVRHLASSIGLKIVSDIRPIKFRKLLLMNGSQLGYSVLAHIWGGDYLSEYHSDRPDALRVLMQDLLTAVEHSLFDYGDELHRMFDWYYRRILASMGTGEDGKGDTTARMLHKASTVSGDEYETDVEAKLGDAVRILQNWFPADVVDNKLLKRAYDAALSPEFRSSL